MEANNNELIDYLNREYMEGARKVKSNIYFDIACLIDFKMTALLCVIDPEEYDVIKLNLPFYNIRTSTEIVKYFPGLSVVEADVTTYLNDMAHDETKMLRFVRFLQYTEYLEMAIIMLTMIETSNLTVDNTSRINLTIGGTTWPTPSGALDHITDMVNRAVPTTRVMYNQTPLIEGSVEYVSSFEHFSLLELEPAMNAPNFSQNIKTGKFLGLSIHSHPFVTVDNPKIDNADQLENLSKLMNLFFDYLPVLIRIRTNES